MCFATHQSLSDSKEQIEMMLYMILNRKEVRFSTTVSLDDGIIYLLSTIFFLKSSYPILSNLFSLILTEHH